jgi:hypothetical protein
VDDRQCGYMTKLTQNKNNFLKFFNNLIIYKIDLILKVRKECQKVKIIKMGVNKNRR